MLCLDEKVIEDTQIFSLLHKRADGTGWERDRGDGNGMSKVVNEFLSLRISLVMNSYYYG